MIIQDYRKRGVSSLIIMAGGLMVLGILVAAGVKVGGEYSCGALNNKRQAILTEFIDMLFYSTTVEDGVIRFSMPSTYTIHIDDQYITLKLSNPLCSAVIKDKGYAVAPKPTSLHISPTTLTGSDFCLKKKGENIRLCVEGEGCCNPE